MRRKAFTLIELMVAIAIIIILAVIIVHRAYKAIEKATITAIIRDIHSIKSAAMVFYADTGTWPADRCNAAFTSNTNCTYIGTYRGWDGPYLEKWPPTAKWGGVYLFRNGNNATAAVGGFNWGATTAVSPVRVVSISGVPSSTTALATTAAGKIDMEIDGAVGQNAGSVCYTLASPTTTVYILVSAD